MNLRGILQTEILSIGFLQKTDASGNNLETERLVFQSFPTIFEIYECDQDGKVTDYGHPGMDAFYCYALGSREKQSNIWGHVDVEPTRRCGMGVFFYSLDQHIFGDIYDNTYIGFKDSDSEGWFITRVNDDEIGEVSYDELGTEGMVVDKIRPEGLENIIDY